MEKQGRFENSGLMLDGKITTLKIQPKYVGAYLVLKDVVLHEKWNPDFLIQSKEINRWKYLKGPKKEIRKNASGFEYHYSEGAMLFPDSLDHASRTIITGEGGRAASRTKHVIQTRKGLRRLYPVELERLNMFPDDHTQLDGISDTKRAFLMGNAVVVGLIEKIGIALAGKIRCLTI